jgi:tRNA (mo5U34)-methyltransferase
MAALSATEVQRLVDGVPHWHHIFHFPHGISSPGAYDPRELFGRLGLPDLHGQRVLDVGTRDGFFAFACERLGAEVVAMDNLTSDKTGFEAARQILGSNVECKLANVYDVDPRVWGEFDIVLFLGVLYHLRHPLLALDRLRAVCRGRIYVESLACDDGVFLDMEHTKPLQAIAPDLVGIPIAQFLPYGRFHPDASNKWAPNVACVRALLEDALFTVEDVHVWPGRVLTRAAVADSQDGRWRITTDAGVV